MLSTRILSKGTRDCSSYIRLSSPIWHLRSSLGAIRRSSTSPAPAQKDFGSKNPVFPERLIVYHAGTARSAFLGSLKVTTIFIFTFFCLVVAPAHWYEEDGEKWVAPVITLSGIVPLVSVAYLSAPFVTHAHLRLPRYARQSREILNRYTQNLSKDANLEITTMSFIGKPRLSVVKVGDLRPVKERFGIVNYVRDTKKINSDRPWYMYRAVRRFGLHGGVPLKGNPGVWENIVKAIKKN